MLTEIQAALRDAIRADAERVGPFLVRFDVHSDHLFLNYAVPDDGVPATPAEVDALVTAFRERSRTPRLEYLRPAPLIDEVLEAAGFTVDQLLPMMVIDVLNAPPLPDGLVVEAVTSDADLLAASVVQNTAFGVGETAGEEDLERQRALLRDNGVVVLARLNGEPVGAGAYTAPRYNLSQVAGIAVLPSFRRRGVASAVCADLTARVFDSGCTPFLETEPDEKVTRLYGPLGYRTIGESASTTLKQGDHSKATTLT
ncbi:ribosomal protein S18 acetylase RimI-like enzyme [Saccharothrix ecbatanensis]|uniref:Ribosomal protein S18 acetylase RimI-like enzyme n=1 Tax=Saccharothrix ecbatanensis TaxID=1105145 RepID=A0A7W9HTQ5_9PSEU|nr:GNAT family N-acetyltransferase [Saccharothrix ecbatanensis]MBB5808312.1 ribosomal protein S18 acetylase RimI-like enzyme [Saccharothrix ecbatanensis]